jgi:DnaK suppressor protein
MKKPEPPRESPETYRQMLLDRRREVISAMGGKFDALAKMGRVGEDDQAQLSHDEFVSLHLNSLDYAQLRLVQEALDRLDTGDFGVCLACEEPIPAKRLRVISWARYCVPCQDSVGRELDHELAMSSR